MLILGLAVNEIDKIRAFMLSIFHEIRDFVVKSRVDTSKDIMKKFLTSLIVLLALFLVDLPVLADTITMKNGRIIQGKFLGGTEDTVRFKANDKIVTYQVKEIFMITFFPTPSSQSQTTSSLGNVQTAQLKPKKPAIAQGTRISVRMTEAVDTIISRKGDWFSATLESALIGDGKVLIPKGTKVRGQIVQAEQGKYGSALVVTLRELILKQQVILITTTNYTAWDRSQGASDSNVFNTPKRSRILRIASQMVIAFKTTESVEIDISQE